MLLLTFPRAVLGLHAGATTLQSVSVYFLVAACAKWNIPFRQGHDEVEMVYTIHILVAEEGNMIVFPEAGGTATSGKQQQSQNIR